MTRSNYSELLVRFAQKTGSKNPRDGMRRCVQSLLDGLPGSARLDIPSAMNVRNIHEFSFESDLKYDGYIEPIGHSFSEGFRIGVRPHSDARVRFTLAHEICHTFFYELVPELKFRASSTDPGEESLCNFGAGELLVPKKNLEAEATTRYASLRSLETLANRYQVSLEVMLFRLRSCRLWSCRMLRWCPMSNGTFALENIYGAPFKDWRVWIADEMNSVWGEPGSKKSGTCYASLVDEHGNWASERVYYELKRYGDHLTMLWSKKPFGLNPEDAPLFMRRALSLSLFETCPSI